jgi:2-iminobutanoate/2-iminopropanoate deaminase
MMGGPLATGFCQARRAAPRKSQTPATSAPAAQSTSFRQRLRAAIVMPCRSSHGDHPMQRLLAVAAFSLVLASASYAQTFEKKNFNYSKFAKGAFSEVVTVTGPAKMIYLAGIGSEDEDDGSVRHMDDFLQQCRFAWQKIGKLLNEHGATVSDIVKATTYVTDIRYRDEMRKCRTEVFAGKPLPPHTLLNVVQLARPGMMFEVDIVAAVAAK